MAFYLNGVLISFVIVLYSYLFLEKEIKKDIMRRFFDSNSEITEEKINQWYNKIFKKHFFVTIWLSWINIIYILWELLKAAYKDIKK